MQPFYLRPVFMTYLHNILLCCTGVDLLVVWIYCCAGLKQDLATPAVICREGNVFSGGTSDMLRCLCQPEFSISFPYSGHGAYLSDGAIILLVACKDGRLHPPRRAAKGAWYSLLQLAKPNGC